ncbi:MAG TPA: triose-phosphate isomerase, partial [Hydrogenophaga sp.]|nr:triose-phosphate isomerase [Hydrogenophaga sp.]
MKKLIAGNWKMNGSLVANEALVNALLSGLGPDEPVADL